MPPPRVEPRISAEPREVTVESFLPLAAAMGVTNPEQVRERFIPGRRCFALYTAADSGAPDIAAFGWVSRCPEYIGEQERVIHVGADEAYIWDCATLPAYRGKHLYSALLSHMLSVLAQENVQRVWIGAGANNYASLHGFATAGFRPVIEVTYTRFLKLTLTRIAAQPQASRELVSAARRVWISDEEHGWDSLVWRWARH